MKTAEEIAIEIIRVSIQSPNSGSNQEAKQQIIAKLLAAYADERVKEAIVRQYEGDQSPVAEIEHETYAKGRNEALEEAAKVAETILLETSCRSDSHCLTAGDLIALKIRELKSRPAQP